MRMGCDKSAMISPATDAVRLTSLVGTSQRPSVVRKLSSANLGSCPVPVIDARVTSAGAQTSS